MKKVKEKTYFECLNEISQNKLFKGLLGYGMFAERIPNFLTSKPFYKYCKNNKDKIFPKRKMGYQYITYEGIRDIGTPRYFAIPNPLAYYNQCKILRDNWDKLKKYFKEKTDGNTHKISRIHIQKIPKNKKIFQNDYSKDRVAMRKSIFDMGHKDIFCEGKLGRSIRKGQNKTEYRLAKCLKKYNLSLNHKKTKIFELPLMYEEEWINQLKIFKMDEYKGKIKYPSVVLF
ncbi:hypothetical protein ID0203_00790 [Helicobacter pylori]